LFRNCHVLTPEERRLYTYRTSSTNDDNDGIDHVHVDDDEEDDSSSASINIWAAYLDGCSIVINHADMYSPWIAALCNDLQQNPTTTNTQSSTTTKDEEVKYYYFPHVYANTYLTPPGGIQTAPPHADDRDVFIVQLAGCKTWTVYEHVPIPYPYSEEQVGKVHGKVPVVPPLVLQGPKVFNRLVLHPGDVLYMPRGYVHEAVTPPVTENHNHTMEPSFHVTLAIATHDWTLAGMLGHELIPTVLEQVVDYRKALVPSPQLSSLQSTLNTLFQQLQTQITATVVQNHLQQKLHVHNQRATRIRQALFETALRKYKNPQTTSAAAVATSGSHTAAVAVVGSEAAQYVSLTSRLRPATLYERSSCSSTAATRGLHVRDDVADAVTEMIGRLKTLSTTVEVPPVWPCLQDWPTVLLLPHGIQPPPTLCSLTLLSVAKLCVELGALAVVA
jgi:hypothetical protein